MGVNVREKVGESLAVADLADHGHVVGHVEKPGDEPPQVDAGPVGPGGAGLHPGHVGHRDVGLSRSLTGCT